MNEAQTRVMAPPWRHALLAAATEAVWVDAALLGDHPDDAVHLAAEQVEQACQLPLSAHGLRALAWECLQEVLRLASAMDAPVGLTTFERCAEMTRGQLEVGGKELRAARLAGVIALLVRIVIESGRRAAAEPQS